MPSSQAKKHAPRATRQKRMKHAFHLLQPFFQFAALIIVVLAFVRCSPLAPSTDKAHLLGGDGPGILSNNVLSEAEEQAIAENMKNVKALKTQVLSETDFREITNNVKSSDDSIDEATAASIFAEQSAQSRNRGMKRLYVNLTADQSKGLIAGKTVRLNLKQLFTNTSERARLKLVKGLRAALVRKDLKATGIFVMPDATMKRVQGGFDDLSFILDVAISAPSDANAYVQASRSNIDGLDDSNATLLDAAAKEALNLAIVLE
jgi:hypothetical protein